MRDFNDASRREFLGSLATVGAGMLLPASVLAQRSTVPPARKGLIDVHHHIGPAPNTGQRGGGGSVNWSPAKAVEEMDRNGIATGIGYPGPVQSTPSDLDRGRRQARELNRRKAVVYVHPNDDRCCTPSTLTYEKQGISGPWLEWPVNTARTILSLMTNGITREFPGIRFIFSHGGGVMPLLIHRIAGFTDWDAVGPERLRALFPNGIEAEFRKLYFEGAQAYSPVNMDALMKLVPASHILFGTDYDRFPIAHSVKLFAALRLSSNVRRAIERDNAVTLLPRWA